MANPEKLVTQVTQEEEKQKIWIQYNYNNYLQNMTQKTNDRATRTPL
jgi:DNA primase